MKNIEVSEKRWYKYLSALTALGKGTLGQQLPIKQHQDDFEKMEVLFNMVNEELKERFLHLSFVKPTEFQRYHQSYVLFLRPDLKIKNSCDGFLNDFQFHLSTLQASNFLDMIDEDSAAHLREHIADILSGASNPNTHLQLLKRSFLYHIKTMDAGKTVVIQLHEFNLNPKYFPTTPLTKREKSKLEVRRKNEILIEKVKNYVDNHPLKERVIITVIAKEMNSNATKIKKLFKEYYQICIYEYFLSKRMQHAHLQIETSEQYFYEIAESVGYPLYPEFIKCYKKHYNMLPKEVRSQYQNALAEANNDSEEKEVGKHSI